MPQDEVVASFYLALNKPEPPSINKMYSTGSHGQRFLTKVGAAFKAALTKAVVDEVSALPWKDAVDEVYSRRGYVRILISLNIELFNASWKPGGKTKSGAMQSPYKKIDGPNYSKAVEDAVADGTGIDDSCHLDSRVVKTDGARMIEVFYEVLRRTE